ncbi:hypothetical protein H2203_007206 [Taxawa tesnikishii (nom. ined.)]|nr:hypothetical protein H2203_007206 [Dothideales sp. JES 119]
MAVDTKGDTHGRAMQHFSVGIYIAELCLIGLIVILLILTFAYQDYLNLILAPLTNSLSDEVRAEDDKKALDEVDVEGGEAIDGPSDGIQPKRPNGTSGNKMVDEILRHGKQGGLLSPFLFHGSRSKYHQSREQVREAFPGKPVPRLSKEIVKHAYHHPAITAKPPKS